MFTTETTDIRIATFSSNREANEILHNAEQIIKAYGHVSLVDILDLCGKNGTYKDAKIGWTEATFKNAKVKRIREGYVICMPKYDWFDDASMIKASDEQPQPEPINITIPAEKPEIIRETISAICSDIEKIKDRPVFINFSIPEWY